MRQRLPRLMGRLRVLGGCLLGTLFTTLLLLVGSAPATDATDQRTVEANYKKHVLPVIRKYCFECHNAETQEGNVRLDNLDPDLIKGKDAERWHHALDMINQGDMPPEDADRPDAETLGKLTEWIQNELIKSIKAHRATNKAIMRRMTREQYTHSVQSLLGLDIRFGDGLPKDAKSKSGFSNNANVLQITPLHLDYYQKIAREALDQAIFVEKPEVVRYRIRIGTDLGVGIDGSKRAGKFGGFVSQPVDPRHLIAEVLGHDGMPIEVTPKPGRYGNVLQNLGVDMRGSDRQRYEMSDLGMKLDAGVPHVEKAPGSWHAPSPNLKMLIRRDFPMKGNFAFRVTAARLQPRVLPLPVKYDATDPLIAVDAAAPADANVLTADKSQRLVGAVVQDGVLVKDDKKEKKKRKQCRVDFVLELEHEALYQVDVLRQAFKGRVTIGVEFPSAKIKLNKKINAREKAAAKVATPVGIVRLAKGEHRLQVKWNGECGIHKVVIAPLPTEHSVRKEYEARLAKAMKAAEEAPNGQPVLQVSLGNRTDDGQDAQRFDEIQKIRTPAGQFKRYEFVGRLENLPTPQLDLNEMTSLSNILVLSVWNGDFIKDRKRSGSCIAVNELEFEAPYFPQWPPQSHRQIFFDSPNAEQKEVYAREILERFMTRAFRRPLKTGELDLYHRFWTDIRGQHASFEAGIQEVLVAVLCSPKFIFLAESNRVEKTKKQRDFELATKLAYFLWNGPPDSELLEAAEQGKLRSTIASHVQRMVDDKRSHRFVVAFCDQWLKLNRHYEMQVDIGRYPAFTRYVKEDLGKETYYFFEHIMRRNLAISNLIDSSFVVINQNLAEFYGIEGVKGTDFRPVKISADQGRGGLLTQGSFLSGHSDGKQAHPIKRAVWLMERILGESPPPPPPNVPDLDPKDPKNRSLPIAKQLAIHRDNSSCRNCHKKLDPFGLVFESYNGAGLFSASQDNPDTKVTLPDGTVVDGVPQMKAYILKNRMPAFTASLVEHLMTFALGRDISFVDEDEIKGIVERVHAKGGRMRTLLEEICTSRMFLE